MSRRSSEWQPWPALSGTQLTLGRRLTRGKLVEQLETRLSERLGAHVVATSSGTAALECAMTAIGVKEGTTVVVPEYGFHAAALAARRCGARIATVKVDPALEFTVQPLDLMNVLLHTRDVSAVVVIDQAGYLPDYRELGHICELFAVPIVEDAACAWGTWDDSHKMAGTFGHVGILSLSESKMVGAGEGGVVIVKDPLLAEHLMVLRRYGELDDGPSMKRAAILPGSNWKMPEATAHIALLQLERLPERIATARANAQVLDNTLLRLSKLSGPIARGHVTWHKYRVRGPDDPGAVSLDVGELDVLPDDFLPIPMQRGLVLRTTLTANLVLNTFCVGSRDEPLWHAREETVRRWARGLERLNEQLVERKETAWTT